MKLETTQAMLLDHTDYDPSTGILVWKPRDPQSFPRLRSGMAWNTRFSGKAVGAIHDSGYLYTKYNGGVHLVHRLIWLRQYGSLPEQIDHINHCRSDNRLENLRTATPHINGSNITLPSRNTSSRIGVYRGRGVGTWVAKICVMGKRIHLGTYGNFDDAVKARHAAELKYAFHENHGMPANDNAIVLGRGRAA